MKKILYFSLSIATLTLLTGCSAKGPQFLEFEKPNEGKSLVYIYRNGLILGAGVQANIHKTDLDSQEDQIIGKVQPSGYIKTEVDANKNIEIWARTEWKNEIEITTENQKVYCVQHYISPGVFVGHPQFELQSLEVCEPEIKKTKLSLQNNDNNEVIEQSKEQ